MPRRLKALLGITITLPLENTNHKKWRVNYHLVWKTPKEPLAFESLVPELFIERIGSYYSFDDFQDYLLIVPTPSKQLSL